MVGKDLTIIPPRGKAIARRNNGRLAARAETKLAAAGLGLMHEHLSDEVVKDFAREPRRSQSITREQANAMLHFLFNSMGSKRRDDSRSPLNAPMRTSIRRMGSVASVSITATANTSIRRKRFIGSGCRLWMLLKLPADFSMGFCRRALQQ